MRGKDERVRKKERTGERREARTDKQYKRDETEGKVEEKK